ncbi:MAG TPA: hypothetical protein VMV81_07930, partial [Phycisphaerae bacterium]|nr:hypothetical protein [Phycisphaerae bacterium]
PTQLQADAVKADPSAAQLTPGLQPIAPQAQPAAPMVAPAPPLDDWDKYVISVTEKYHFEEAQITKAQSILRELKRRANQYRLSRADELARAELITDVRARESQMKSLNRPLDAMFDELKQRLESLPTMEQRQKAAATPAKR